MMWNMRRDEVPCIGLILVECTKVCWPVMNFAQVFLYVCNSRKCLERILNNILHCHVVVMNCLVHNGAMCMALFSWLLTEVSKSPSCMYQTLNFFKLSG